MASNRELGWTAIYARILAFAAAYVGTLTFFVWKIAEAAGRLA